MVFRDERNRCYFSRKHPLEGHPKKTCFLNIKKLFVRSKYPKTILFYFENNFSGERTVAVRPGPFAVAPRLNDYIFYNRMQSSSDTLIQLIFSSIKKNEIPSWMNVSLFIGSKHP